MNKKYLTIGVENNTLDLIRSAIANDEALGLFEIIKNLKNVEIDIVDYTDEFNYAAQFLAENELKDENIFFEDFNIGSFSRQIEFYYPNDYYFSYLLEHSVFFLASVLSKKLKTRCIVLYENMTVPIGLFADGKLVSDFNKYNFTFFRDKIWKPQQI